MLKRKKWVEGFRTAGCFVFFVFYQFKFSVFILFFSVIVSTLELYLSIDKVVFLCSQEIEELEMIEDPEPVDVLVLVCIIILI